jgi:hypothetical protein
MVLDTNLCQAPRQSIFEASHAAPGAGGRVEVGEEVRQVAQVEQIARGRVRMVGAEGEGLPSRVAGGLMGKRRSAGCWRDRWARVFIAELVCYDRVKAWHIRI